jgi:nucleoside-diphosphate-sugar epimerase
MILLTGGTGFIGSYLLYYLLQEHESIRATRRAGSSLQHTEFIFRHLHVTDPTPKNESWQQMLSRVQWVEADILDTEALSEATKGIDTVFHAAASVSFNPKKGDHTRLVNIEGTANVVNACIENSVRKLAYVSSVAALARKPDAKVNEDDELDELKFTNAYSESKYFAEMEVWRGQAEGLEVVVINPGIVLGWGNFNNGSPEMFKTIADGLKFYPPGANAFVDVRDVAKALILLNKDERATGRRFIAASANISYKQLFDQMANALGVRAPYIAAGKKLTYMVWLFAEAYAFITRGSPFVTKDMAMTSTRTYYYDTNRLVNELSYQYLPLEQTLKDTAAAYKDWKSKR